ncbi:MAG: DUF1223 domain-containing protein [Alphaproteobacteria bacterium]|nr:DUF1223 domain-containing protein [Alphaproteobacteria bacterium]
MRKLATILFALALLVHAQPARAGDGDPVVVELFTSQACPACPPAEAFLRELAGRGDVIALEYHIDYYDYSGWKDPFGDPEFTRRWRGYAQALDARYEYTPFMVVGGRAHVVGSERAEVEQRILLERKQAEDHPRLTLEMTEDAAIVTIDGDGPAGIFDVILAAYDSKHQTVVTAGENRGKTLTNVNVVRGAQRVAQWAGDPVTVKIPLSQMTGDGGCAVLLQRAGGGPILAAASADF